MNDLISRQAAIERLEEHRRIFCKDHTEFTILSDKDKARVDEIDNCIATLINLPSAQPERIQNNAVHLCDSCQYTYVTCPSHGNDAVFGDGKGNDNICACNKYRSISAQPEQRWIPCSERLPEEYGNYLITTHDGNVDIGTIDPKKKSVWSACDADGFYWLREVVAWMPLPKPYEAERKEE